MPPVSWITRCSTGSDSGGFSGSDSGSGGISCSDSGSVGVSSSDSGSVGVSSSDSDSGGVSDSDSGSGGVSGSDRGIEGVSGSDSGSGGVNGSDSVSTQSFKDPALYKFGLFFMELTSSSYCIMFLLFPFVLIKGKLTKLHTFNFLMETVVTQPLPPRIQLSRTVHTAHTLVL